MSARTRGNEVKPPARHSAKPVRTVAIDTFEQRRPHDDGVERSRPQRRFAVALRYQKAARHRLIETEGRDMHQAPNAGRAACIRERCGRECWRTFSYVSAARWRRMPTQFMTTSILARCGCHALAVNSCSNRTARRSHLCACTGRRRSDRSGYRLPTITSCFLRSSAATAWRPMKPAPPSTKTRIR